MDWIANILVSAIVAVAVSVLTARAVASRNESGRSQQAARSELAAEVRRYRAAVSAAPVPQVARPASDPWALSEESAIEFAENVGRLLPSLSRSAEKEAQAHLNEVVGAVWAQIGRDFAHLPEQHHTPQAVGQVTANAMDKHGHLGNDGLVGTARKPSAGAGERRRLLERLDAMEADLR